MRELLDRTLTDDCDVRHLPGVIIDAIRSNKVFVVKELLHHNLPMSPIYAFEAFVMAFFMDRIL